MYIFVFVHHIIDVGIENRTLVSIGSSHVFVVVAYDDVATP
jgi:hypothetical protein